jgi:hypothetical protein
VLHTHRPVIFPLITSLIWPRRMLPTACPVSECLPCPHRNQYTSTSTSTVIQISELLGKQAVPSLGRLRLATAAARIQARVRSCGICGRQISTRTGFLPVPLVSHAISSTDSFTLIEYQVDSVSPQTNYMVWVRERTIPTERPPLVGEMIATWSAWRIHTAVFSIF